MAACGAFKRSLVVVRFGRDRRLHVRNGQAAAPRQLPPQADAYCRAGNGNELVTLRDAANVLLEVFGSVNARYGALDYTIQRLLKAAETSNRADLEAATDSIERVLRARRLLPPTDD